VIAACDETSLVGLRDRAVMLLLVWAQAESPSDDMRDSGFTLGIKARRSLSDNDKLLRQTRLPPWFRPDAHDR
jgi:hypothetical protein